MKRAIIDRQTLCHQQTAVRLSTPLTRLSTYGYRAYSVAAVRIWITVSRRISHLLRHSCLLPSLEDIILLTLLSLICRAREVTVIYGHVNVLTYLLTHCSVHPSSGEYRVALSMTLVSCRPGQQTLLHKVV